MNKILWKLKKFLSFFSKNLDFSFLNSKTTFYFFTSTRQVERRMNLNILWKFYYFNFLPHKRNFSSTSTTTTTKSEKILLKMKTATEKKNWNKFSHHNFSICSVNSISMTTSVALIILSLKKYEKNKEFD